jgi:uncharacterized protein (DUF58 family)
MITTEEILTTVRRIHVRTRVLVESILAGAYASVFKGVGMEFQDVREYQRGDDIRAIDWNVTARMGEPYVKTYREERDLSVFLVVDISPSLFFGTREKAKREVVAEVGALLALSAIHNNDNVGLILFSDGVEKYIPPKKSVKHVIRIIRDLLVYEPKKKGSSLDSALAFFNTIRKRPCVCFVLSDFLQEPCDKTLAMVSRRHDLIGVAVNDIREHAIPDVGIITLCDSETGEHRAFDTSDARVRADFKKRFSSCRRLWKKAMGKAVADIITIDTQEQPYEALHRYFKRRKEVVR